MSRSWIIRSSTTSTSSERGVKMLSRCASKNIGLLSSGNVARTAGLKRSKMSGLRDPPMLLCQRDEFVGFSNRDGQRLLDQHVHAVLHQFAADR